VQSGAVTNAELDRMVTHILTAMFRVGLFDHPTPDPVTVKATDVSTPQHQALSERIAEQGSLPAGLTSPYSTRASAVPAV
jgi:beta-glucosidase